MCPSSSLSHVAVRPKRYLYDTHSYMYIFAGEADKCTSSIINKSTSYVFLIIVLNIPTLQLENSLYLTSSRIHCSFNTSVGTPINTFASLFLRHKD